MENAAIYQFRYYIKGIIPLIWRRLHITGNQTLGDFHHSIQMSLGWTNYHMHEFKIRGKAYETYDPLEKVGNTGIIPIHSLKLRKNEKFYYEYNFNSDWKLEIRLEAILQPAKRRVYPICIAGARSGPPEEISGPEEYMELTDYYSELQIMQIILDKLNEIQQEGGNINELKLTVSELEFWVNKEKCDEKKINILLAKFATKGTDWEEYMQEE